MELDIESQTQSAQRQPPSVFGKTNSPVTLKFEDVIYRIKIKQQGKRKGKGLGMGGSNTKSDKEKVILNGVTGVVLPGEMLALLGPSGSGKTTLLTALGGRLGGNLSGSITYNGKPYSTIVKQNTGFVTQDDVLYPHLTVTETLVFTALLRLPNSLSKEEKQRQAESVITQLGLTRCKNSMVGGHFLRGVSGGERKRVSIGQELLINPSLIFLDEPTSGLDSTTAQRIVSTLWELAMGGRTVLMTIHQPSSRLFYMFHKVLLLSDGHPIYFGKGSEALDYFSTVGYSLAVAMNPADFLLDLANGVSSEGSGEDQALIKQALASAYTIHLSDKVKKELHEANSYSIECFNKMGTQRWNTSWWQQFTVLLQRGLKERKYQYFDAAKVTQITFVATLAGLLWWQSDIAHIQDQIGLLFFVSGFWGLLPVTQAIFTFPQERKMLTKERRSSMYRLSSYFMSRMAADTPMALVLPFVFVSITYWMAGLKPTVGNFLESQFVVLLCVVASESIGLAIGALIMDVRDAIRIGSMLMLTFLLTGGFYVQNVPAFISWTKYISHSYYFFKLLIASQYFPDETYPCKPGVTCMVGDLPSIKLVGINQKGPSIAALTAMIVVYRLIAYLALMRIG